MGAPRLAFETLETLKPRRFPETLKPDRAHTGPVMHWLRDQLPHIVTGACVALILVFLPRKVRLWLQGLIFTVLVPGVVAFFLPQWLRTTPAAGGWWSLVWILFAAGAAIYLRCLVDFLRAGGTPAIFFTRPLRAALGEEPKQVVRSGFYRYSRNPMYLGVFAAIAGQACVYRSRTIAIYLLIAITFFHCVVVFLEEPHLARARGPAYDDYRRRVPRWLGLPRQ